MTDSCSGGLGVLSAPSNLGLRPPEPSVVPGTCRAPEALRDGGLHARLAQIGATDLGVVLPGRYRDDFQRGVERLRNQASIVDHCRRLADRLESLPTGSQVLVLGGDCGILVGSALWLRRRGRFGLVHVDGHTDYRHPGNSPNCASLAGEDLAAVTGRHWPGVADLDGLGPYFDPDDVVHVGCRDDDQGLAEVRRDLAGGAITAREVMDDPESALRRVQNTVVREDLDGYWLHLDVDVLDPSYMPAVDSPSPGGLDPDHLTRLLRSLWPGAVGLQVCVFDPDLDPTGDLARLLVDVLIESVAPGA
jgi:arginase